MTHPIVHVFEHVFDAMTFEERYRLLRMFARGGVILHPRDAILLYRWLWGADDAPLREHDPLVCHVYTDIGASYAICVDCGMQWEGDDLCGLSAALG